MATDEQIQAEYAEINAVDIEDPGLIDKVGFPYDVKLNAVAKQYDAGMHVWGDARINRNVWNADGDDSEGAKGLPYKMDTPLTTLDGFLFSGSGPADDMLAHLRSTIDISGSAFVKDVGYETSEVAKVLPVDISLRAYHTGYTQDARTLPVRYVLSVHVNSDLDGDFYGRIEDIHTSNAREFNGAGGANTSVKTHDVWAPDGTLVDTIAWFEEDTYTTPISPTECRGYFHDDGPTFTITAGITEGWIGGVQIFDAAGAGTNTLGGEALISIRENAGASFQTGYGLLNCSGGTGTFAVGDTIGDTDDIGTATKLGIITAIANPGTDPDITYYRIGDLTDFADTDTLYNIDDTGQADIDTTIPTTIDISTLSDFVQVMVGPLTHTNEGFSGFAEWTSEDVIINMVANGVWDATDAFVENEDLTDYPAIVVPENVETGTITSDESQATSDDVVTSVEKIGQTFTPSETQLGLFTVTTNNDLTGADVYAYIQETTASEPSGQIKAIAMLEGTIAGEMNFYFDFTYDTAVMHAITIEAFDRTTGENVEIELASNSAGGYASGTAYTIVSDTYAAETDDLVFEASKITVSDSGTSMIEMMSASPRFGAALDDTALALIETQSDIAFAESDGTVKATLPYTTSDLATYPKIKAWSNDGVDPTEYNIEERAAWEGTPSEIVITDLEPGAVRIFGNAELELAAIPADTVSEGYVAYTDMAGISAVMVNDNLVVTRKSVIDDYDIHLNDGWYWLEEAEAFNYTATNEVTFTGTTQALADIKKDTMVTVPGYEHRFDYDEDTGLKVFSTEITLDGTGYDRLYLPHDNVSNAAITSPTGLSYSLVEDETGTYLDLTTDTDVDTEYTITYDLDDSFFVDGELLTLSTSATDLTVQWQKEDDVPEDTGVNLSRAKIWDERFFLAYSDTALTVSSAIVYSEAASIRSGYIPGGIIEVVLVWVIAYDANDVPVEGATVTWDTPTNGALVNAETTTNLEGRACAYYTVPTDVGTSTTEDIGADVDGETATVNEIAVLASIAPSEAGFEWLMTYSGPTTVRNGVDAVFDIFVMEDDGTPYTGDVTYRVDNIGIDTDDTPTGDTLVQITGDTVEALTDGVFSFTHNADSDNRGIYLLSVTIGTKRTRQIAWRVF